MKTLTVQIPDDICQNVERRAAARGATVGEEIVELLQRFQARHDEVEKKVLSEIAAIFGAPPDKLLTLAQ